MHCCYNLKQLIKNGKRAEKNSEEHIYEECEMRVNKTNRWIVHEAK